IEKPASRAERVIYGPPGDRRARALRGAPAPGPLPDVRVGRGEVEARHDPEMLARAAAGVLKERVQGPDVPLGHPGRGMLRPKRRPGDPGGHRTDLGLGKVA